MLYHLGPVGGGRAILLNLIGRRNQFGGHPDSSRRSVRRPIQVPPPLSAAQVGAGEKLTQSASAEHMRANVLAALEARGDELVGPHARLHEARTQIA